MTPMFCEFNSQADGNTVSIILKSADLHSPQVQNYKAISICTNSRWIGCHPFNAVKSFIS